MKPLFLIMGLLSVLFGNKPAAIAAEISVQLDLGEFKSGKTMLGESPKPGEPFTGHFDPNGVAKFEKSGIELGTKDGVLDYAFITLTNFTGSFLKSGVKIHLSARTTTEEIIAQFGPPYWKDADDDEVILFYEFQCGRVELQFEFPGKRHLGFITLARDGVLSKPDQRMAYGVTKQWPPK